MALAATALVRRDRGTAAVATMLLAQLTMGFRKHRGGGGGGGGDIRDQGPHGGNADTPRARCCCSRSRALPLFPSYRVICSARSV